MWLETFEASCGHGEFFKKAKGNAGCLQELASRSCEKQHGTGLGGCTGLQASTAASAGKLACHSAYALTLQQLQKECRHRAPTCAMSCSLTSVQLHGRGLGATLACLGKAGWHRKMKERPNLILLVLLAQHFHLLSQGTHLIAVLHGFVPNLPRLGSIPVQCDMSHFTALSSSHSPHFFQSLNPHLDRLGRLTD